MPDEMVRKAQQLINRTYDNGATLGTRRSLRDRRQARRPTLARAANKIRRWNEAPGQGVRVIIDPSLPSLPSLPSRRLTAAMYR
ncbi:hypothetical protein [Streptomyces flavidovirens]|uniref:hypothetical protein n=1 Tax=Streptomyces flavidovirens TaxID=67298 RepID=UPI0012FEA275|nr:hypothetical protein [Streptomyces flavidovirens]